MKIFHMVQGSPDWWEARRGLITGSSADRILTPGGKPSGQQDGYVAELIGEKFTLIPGFFTEKPMTTAMRHGRNFEPEARQWVAMALDREVQMVGGCLSDCGRFWVSPDGLIIQDGKSAGGLELKCPIPKTQVEYLLAGELPPEYRPQVHMQLLVTGLPFVEFVSYSPGLKPFVVTVRPDAFTIKLADELERFWGKLQAAIRLVAPQPEAVA